jgi:uncharacterized membrane protein
MQERTRDIAVAGVLSAVAVLLAVTQLGFIPFVAGVSITVMHVPIVIGAVVAGPAVGTFIGLIFGVSSLILAAVAPKGPGDVFFTDPWVSVLPRLFIGVAAWGAYHLARTRGRGWTLALGAIALVLVVSGIAYTIGTADLALALPLAVGVGVIGLTLIAVMLRRASQANPEELALSLAAVVGTLTNTVLVLSALVLRSYIPGGVALTVGVANGPAEMVAATVITVAVVATWRQIALRPGRSGV